MKKAIILIILFYGSFIIPWCFTFDITVNHKPLLGYLLFNFAAIVFWAFLGMCGVFDTDYAEKAWEYHVKTFNFIKQFLKDFFL